MPVNRTTGRLAAVPVHRDLASLPKDPSLVPVTKPLQEV
jgi:hypothetical protein